MPSFSSLLRARRVCVCVRTCVRSRARALARDRAHAGDQKESLLLELLPESVLEYVAALLEPELIVRIDT